MSHRNRNVRYTRCSMILSIINAVDGAESLEHLYARSGSFIHDVLTPEFVSGKNVLIVAHGALDCSLICQYEEIPLEHFWDQLLGNCELRRLVSSANV